MINRIVIFIIRNYYKTLPSKRILVKHIIADLPEIARREIVESLLPAGTHCHRNPKKKITSPG